MFSWWPVDLVLAPDPGFSPDFGGAYAIVGSYFLDLDKPNPDTPNSLVGAFGWYAENGSYAGGAGAKFTLLNDRLRRNAAAGYGDSSIASTVSATTPGTEASRCASISRRRFSEVPRSTRSCRIPISARIGTINNLFSSSAR
jgi:hypothetical protein